MDSNQPTLPPLTPAEPAADLPLPPAHSDGRGRHDNHHLKPGHTVLGGGRPAGALEIKKMITHDMIIDFILANPRATNKEIGAAFGYGAQGISVILHSDAFQARYLKRQGDVCNPLIASKLEDRITAMAARSAEIVHQRLEDNPLDHKFALEVLKTSTHAAGMGAPKPPQINTQFVVHLPGPATSSSDWVSKFSPQSGQMVLPDVSDSPSEGGAE